MPIKEYEYLHRNKFITTDAKSIDDFIQIFEDLKLAIKIERINE